MPVTIRDVRENELDAVLALNNSAGTTILPIDDAGIRWFNQNARYFRVAEVDGKLAAFLVGIADGTDYASPNYRWFAQHYPAFVYIDRIVVARPFRGLGLGRLFYADVTSFAEARVPMLTCEVFLEPRDDVSLLFHGTYGFQEVGQQVMEAVNRRVSLLAKQLPSFSFVDETYLRGPAGKLPDVPWLHERQNGENPVVGHSQKQTT
ncbi:MAG: GNAT family N-acetyltransferase [Dokdonella sp.]